MNREQTSLQTLLSLDEPRLTLYSQTRLAIAGSNGSGKTTLLNTLFYMLQQDGRIQVAYARQQLPFYTGSAQDFVCTQAAQDIPDAEKLTQARTLLACLGLDGVKVTISSMQLSPGERQRVVIAGLLIQKPHILLLDEPTNHLALPAREALEKTLSDYLGALVLVSHDKTFREALVHDTFCLSE